MDTMDSNNTQGSMPPPSSGPTGSQTNTGMAILAYIGILVLIPLLSDAKNDPFVKFHIKQGLVLLICYIVASIVAYTPLGFMLSWIIWLACLILMFLGIMNASSGRQVQLPVIGKFADNFHI